MGALRDIATEKGEKLLGDRLDDNVQLALQAVDKLYTADKGQRVDVLCKSGMIRDGSPRR